MGICRETIQSELLKYGSFYEIIKENGIIMLIDFAVLAFINMVSKRLYRLNGLNYGFSEAFFHPRDIDKWSRYAHVVNEIQKIKANNLKVLEVGSGGQGISFYLSPIRRDCTIFLIDVRKDVFKGSRMTYPVVGDGSRLPFNDKVFDIVVSLDAVEHIPKSIRHNFYKELKRVCKKRIILTCPMQSSDGTFQGMTYDIAFQYLYERNYGVTEPNTAEHIAAGHPTRRKIKENFPNSTIHGYKNCDIWLKYMLFSSKPFLGLFSGLIYYLFWKRGDNKAPYWGAIVMSNLPKIVS